MSDSSRGFPTGLPLLGILLFLGASGLFLRPSALKQLRPPPTQPLWAESTQGGTAASRLWQDPLQAIGSAYDRWRADDKRERTNHAVELRSSFAERLAQQDAPWMAVIALVSGSNYSDSESNRQDNRVAVVAALGESGFIPEDREHLNFFVWHPTLARGRPDIGVPFEWFRRDSATTATEPYRNVLVLWLRSDALDSDKTLAGVDSLLDSLLAPGAGDEGRPPRTPDPTVVLLTTSSNRLIDITCEMLADDARAKARGPLAEAPPLPLRIVDWSATIAPRQLSEAIGSRAAIAYQTDSYEQKIAEPVKTDLNAAATRRGVTIERRIGTDGELMDAIVHELALRGIVPGREGARIAVVHEWDTAYGRALPATLRDSVAAALERSGMKGGAARSAAESHVQTYAYLQGIDGVLPVPSGGSGAGPAAAPSPTGSALHAEAPQGRNQLDYVRRLAARIREEESQRPDTERLGAIGVFGNLYDKVPVLQALRAEFPDALLFTTDLEAQLVHASADGSLRNLLIASHYGLRADAAQWQPHAPPFRSSYQTSLFLALRHALKDPGVREGVQLESPSRTARMYEIGRTGVLDLPCSDVRTKAADELHPRVASAMALDGWMLIGGCLAIVAALVLAHFARRVPRVDSAHEAILEPVSRRSLLMALGVTVFASLAVIAWNWFAASDHPIALGFARTTPWWSRTSVERATALIPDFVLLLATVACGRLALLASMARRSTAPDEDTGTWRAGEIYVGSPAFLLTMTVIGFASVLAAAGVRLWRLDYVAVPARAVCGVGAVAIGFGLSWLIRRNHVAFRTWLGTSILRHMAVASVLPALYLLALVPRILPWMQDLPRGVRHVVAMAPPILAIGGVLAAALLFNVPIRHSRRKDEWGDMLSARNWCVLATALVVFVALCFGVERFSAMSDQEPVALWEGVSAWPSIALRCLTVVLGLWFLSLLRVDSRSNAHQVTRHWSLLSEAELHHALFRRMPWLPVPLTIGWNPERVRADSARQPELGYGQATWMQYLDRTRDYGRLLRVAALTIVFLALISPVIPEILRQAHAPYAVRGDIARWLHEAAFLASVGVLAVLTIAVWDVSNLCQRFIALLGVDVREQRPAWRGIWHPHSIALVTLRTGLRGEAAESYLTLRVIAERTRWVSSTIYYPFILIVVLLVAGAGGFDAWPQSWRVILAIVLPTIIAVVAARALQSSAKRLRTQLAERLGRAVGDPIPALTLAEGPSASIMPAREALDAVRSVEGAAASEVAIDPESHASARGPKATSSIELKGPAHARGEHAVPIVGAGPDEQAAVTLPDWVDGVHEGVRLRCSIPLAQRPAEDDRLVLTLARPRHATPWQVVDARRVAAAKLSSEDVRNARSLFDGLRQGAFASYADNPIIRALLLPFGGFGAIQLVEYVMRAL